jgi:FSR family fosmidomycin resistance protein-like MFS transporter
MAFMKLPVVWWCFGFFLLSTMTLAVVQSFSVSILKAMHGISFEAATYTLTAYMLCGAMGMFVGGFIAARSAHSDRVVAMSMAAGAVLLALCGTGLLGATATMVVLAITGFCRWHWRPVARHDDQEGNAQGRYRVGCMGWCIPAWTPVLRFRPICWGFYGPWLVWRNLLGAALVLLLSVGAALGVGQRTGPAYSMRR